MGLPKNWAVVNLEDISKISTGKKNANHANLEGEYEFFTCSINTSKSTTYSFEGPSVIVPGNGNIGYVFYYEDKFEAYQRTYVINEIKIFPKFLFYHFRCLWKKRTSDNLFGSTIQYVKIGHFKNYDINLPPLPEQERIVAKLDLLFGQIEKINEGIENLQNIKDKFQYSCLVDREKKSFYKREKIGQFLEEGTERIGETWNDCRLIGVSAKDGIIDLRTGQKKTFEKYKIVRKGDFIYNTMRVNIGSIAIYKGDEPAITSPDYVVFRTNNRLSSDLLLGFLKGEQGLLEIGANTKGSVRARLYFKSLSEIRMPYNENVQGMAQKFLHEFNISLDKLKGSFDIKIPELQQSILNKAFKGELVPQLPTDGDAKELLKEIEKLKGGIKGKTSKKKK